MFTGIVTDLGKVRSITQRGDTRIEIETHFDMNSVEIGASIACSGACLTVVEKGEGWFAADVSAETLSCTTLGDWKIGSPVNLERPLTANAELGGHMVSGHVDGVGTLRSVRPEGDSKRFTFAAPKELMRYIAAKGSVSVDGVSLTVNEVDDTSFGVNIIPHTQAQTTFGAMVQGTRVNLEIDLVARYVARLLGRD
jgi:riboflavin synthase